MRPWIAVRMVVGLLALAACGGDGGTMDAGPDAADVAGDPGLADVPAEVPADPGPRDEGPADAGTETATDPGGSDDGPGDVGGDAGPWERTPKGEPVDETEIDRMTGLYLEILEKTRYFDVLDERVHGWPRSDAEGRYWYGTWWSGVKILKEDGKIRYLHSADGADNNGMRTGPMLVGACYAHKLWGRSAHRDLLRKIVRGFNSWALAFRSPSFPEWAGKQVLSRAAYPESILSQDGGREFLIDYSLNRPGEDNGACVYVHVPDNPDWGDLYAKNIRSKDDIGHMMIALGMLPDCLPAEGEADPEAAGLRADADEARSLYRAWAQQVDQDGWKIATVDKEGTIYFPDGDLAYLWLSFGNIECEAAVTLRLFGGGNPDDLECGTGIMELDEVEGLKNDVHQIQRSFHEAAVVHAQRAGRTDVARELMEGLAWRVDVNLDRVDAAQPGLNLSDLGELVLMAGNAGLPMTWRDVRFLHARIEAAHAALVGGQDAAALKRRFEVFSPDLPDGEYPFDPGDSGLAWRYLGAVLGACASPFWSADSKPLLDCDRIRNAGGTR